MIKHTGESPDDFIDRLGYIDEEPSQDKGGPRSSKALPFTVFAEIDISGRKRWIVKGVFARGEISGWIAPPGKLKSALLAEVAVHVGAGQDWRGHRSTGPCAVVIFALERGDLVSRRLAAYRARFGFSDLPLAVVSRVLNLMDPACVQAIVDTIREVETQVGLPVGLIVLDTMPKAIAAGGGDEDRAKDKGRAYAHLRQVIDQIDTHIATVGHTGKDEERGPRGSNADVGDLDLAVQIRGDLIKTAVIIKANDRPEGTLISFRDIVHDFGPDEDGDPVTVNILDPEGLDPQTAPKSSNGRKPSPAATIALRALKMAIEEDPEPTPPSNHIPASVRCTTVERWRRYAYQIGISEGEDRAQQKAFKKAADTLIADKLAVVWNKHVWIP